MMRRLKQRQRQQRSIWAMLATKPLTSSDELKVGDLITLKDEYNHGLIGTLKIVQDIEYEFVCCVPPDNEPKSRVIKSHLKFWRRAWD
ncbi:hypothetical protein ACT4WX_09875 [Acinetobacter baumannii]|uniref:hypothetical protein n=1 Tax=Acinetobacter baumannii TaxID=470 RepID=UPI000E154F31|nr:hypothetical protein [Acinetobacter baumannii]MBP4545745.1 hypothetical protein [Acinetobacter baumannii]MCT9561429.1 hypothetical protein [Acinetobacter baumannii]MDC4258978.1 hypothetical protein [Acinetobacter baumannii]MDC4306993.1 hypothetical protein [Acinetobacter baumannii]MDC4334796.1 hypothetical protein [Acinetobacter baumannii]